MGGGAGTGPGQSGTSVAIFNLPLATGKAQVLTTSLAAVGSSRAKLDPADWTTDLTGTITCRIVGRFEQIAGAMLAGDVLEVDFYDAVGAAVVLSGTAIAPTPTDADDEIIHARSAWTTFPASKKLGYVRCRNQTGARGQFQAAWIEVKGTATP